MRLVLVTGREYVDADFSLEVGSAALTLLNGGGNIKRSLGGK